MLSEKMNSLLKDEKTRKLISQKALINADLFSWDKCAMETYKFLINN